MAKKSFKKNNPALQFFTTDEEQAKKKIDSEPPENGGEKQEAQNAHEVQRAQDVHDTQEDPLLFPAEKGTSQTAVDSPTNPSKTPIASGTQGRKGQKLPRINMAFSQDNLEYLQRISRIEGCSMTEYVNRLLQADQEKRADLLEKWDELLGS